MSEPVSKTAALEALEALFQDSCRYQGGALRSPEFYDVRDFIAQSPDVGAVSEREKELSEQVADLRETLDNWFPARDKISEDAGRLLKDGFAGYLRTSRCGGMSAALSTKIEAAFENFCDLYLGEVLIPYDNAVKARLATPPLDTVSVGREDLRAAINAFYTVKNVLPTLGEGDIPAQIKVVDERIARLQSALGDA